MTPTITAKYFSYAHLPPKLQAVSKPVGDLAEKLEFLLPLTPEKSAGMRKLLEAKDCFVRTALEMPEPTASAMPPHQQRVLEERAELKDKHVKLIAFILDGPFFPMLASAEQERLKKQEVLQGELLAVLDERIAAF